MALFNNFFQQKKNVKKDTCRNGLLEGDVIPFSFDKTHVRVLLFRECERRGRKLLYDSSDSKLQEHSKGKESDSNAKNECFFDGAQIESNYGVQCKVTNSDAPLLGEMMFGSVAMNYKGMSLKIHILKSPHRLMCTKVYCNPSRQSYTTNETFVSSHGSMSTHSDGDLFSSTKLTPWPSFETNSPCPGSSSARDERLTFDCFINKSDSGFSSQPSSHSSFGYQNSPYEIWHRNDESFQTDFLSLGNLLDARNPTTSSSAQWHLTQQYTSTFDNQMSSFNIPSRRKDSEVSRSSVNSSTSDNLDNCVKYVQNRRVKMGIAIVLTLSDISSSKMMAFLLDHVFLMEGALSRLKHAVHQALHKPQSFISTMSVASREVAQWLVDLVASPRIGFPIWSCLSSHNKSFAKKKIADLFLNDLCSLLSTMDTKDTYFFMSTLLTNILTFHLGWVSSVSPYNSSQCKDSQTEGNHNVYNPLWTQLSEMYGVIGIPSRVSRTIVYGKHNILLIRKILGVLTYFIRCINVNRYEFEATSVSWESVDNSVNSNQTDIEFDSFVNSSHTNTHQISNCDIEMRTFSSNQNMSIECGTNYKESIITNSTASSFNISVKDNNLVPNPFLNESKNGDQSLNVDSAIRNNINCKNNLSQFSETNENVKNGNVMNILNEQNSSSATNGQSVVKKLCRGPAGGLLFDFIKQTEIDTSNETDNGKQCYNVKNSKVESDQNSVVFILGEDEELVGLKDSSEETIMATNTEAKGESKVEVNYATSEIKEGSLSCAVDKNNPDRGANSWDVEQPKTCCARTPQCQHSTFKKHSGVKFDFEKYPQIVTNYMKSKNLELLDRHVIGKPGNLKFVECEELEAGSSILDLPKDCETCQNCSLNSQGLQTPSNASELEYTSDIPNHEFQYAKESVVAVTVQNQEEELKTFVKKKLSNTVIVNENVQNNSDTETSDSVDSKLDDREEDNITEIPFNSVITKPELQSSGFGYNNTLLGSVSDHYISDFVLQGGVGGTKNDWENSLSRDLKLQPGSTCLLADIDDWSVRVFSSGGVGGGDMSALVASMLDCIPQMCNAKVPSFHCLAFIESKLREMCVRSKGLAQLLIDKDFCDMEYLTKTLNLEPNDVPLLLAIASTHTPQVTLKYGVSYRLSKLRCINKDCRNKISYGKFFKLYPVY